MKLLFDENLSHHLVDDRAIWAYAIEHDHAIVSKDEDFAERALLEGPPPKVVWIRAGNCTTATVDALLRAHHEELAAFATDAEAALIVLP